MSSRWSNPVPATHIMVNHAKSNALKSQMARQQKDSLMAQAVALYQAEKAKPSGEKAPSLRAVCKTVSDDHFSRTQIRICLDHNTLARLSNGGQSLTKANSKKSWLTNAEQDLLVQFVIELAHRGFPLSPTRLREHSEYILRARLGDRFPEGGLRKNWATRFITKHHDRLGMYWSSALDGSRGRAVNPVTKAEYFAILKQVREDFNIPDELVYGADETGIQSGIGVTERVIGPASVKMQHQQRSGNRENITVLPTICADGTSLPPTVIYKGESFQTKWLQDNPLDARCVPVMGPVGIGDTLKLSIPEWVIRRRATLQAKSEWPGYRIGINLQNRRQADDIVSSLLMATARITQWVSWTMLARTQSLYSAIHHILLTSIKDLMLSSSVS